MSKLKLVQLPVPPPAAMAATGNVPLAAGSLAVSAKTHGFDKKGLQIEVIEPVFTDIAGDTELADSIAKDEPAFLGLSLYLWNTERSLHIAREVKKRSPRTTILIGGPEVNPDNPFVLGQDGYDIAVSGEAEDLFPVILQKLLEKESLKGISNISVREQNGKMGEFGLMRKIDFPLTDYKSPYLEGFIQVDPLRSTYLETVRGCKSSCAYCFYPRSSNVLRTLDIDKSKELIRELKKRGAKELVFLDPTFNHRPGFEALVDSIIEVNSDKHLGMFGEFRAEGINPAVAKKLAKAGFNRIEIGMQSVNKDTLKRVKRYGSPELVAEAAKMLLGEGIELLLDLIVGLPGDTPEDVLRGLEFFNKHGLSEWVQVFPLSVLPGTALRRDAEKEGLIFHPGPPYRIESTASFTGEEIYNSLNIAEEVLDRRLDEFPRPHLIDEVDSKNDVLTIDFDKDADFSISKVSNPMSRHACIQFKGNNLYEKRELILKAIKNRIAVDPYSVLDIALVPKNPFPLDLLEMIKREFEKAPQSYLSRALSHRGENLQRRLVVIIREENHFSRDWISDVLSFADIYEDMSIEKAIKLSSKLGVNRPFARIINDSVEEKDWKALVKKADPEAVVFKRRNLEFRWMLDALGYGEK